MEKYILIVDDDIELGDLIVQAISEISDVYDVRVSRNAKEALDMVRKAPLTFDLLLPISKCHVWMACNCSRN